MSLCSFGDCCECSFPIKPTCHYFRDLTHKRGALLADVNIFPHELFIVVVVLRHGT